MTNKVSDFYITLKLENVEGQPVRAKDVTDLKVKVFTSDINTFVEFSDITTSEKEDRLYIDYDQLSDLKSGVICYTYSYKIDDTNFKDKYFNSTNINYTNFYLRQTTQVGKNADLSPFEILAICDRKLVEQYKELKALIDNTPKIEVDKELNDTSDNPVANKVINQKFSDIDNTITQIKNTTPKITVDTNLDYSSDNPVANKVLTDKFDMLKMDIMNVESKIPMIDRQDITELHRSIDEINYEKIMKINQKIDAINKTLEELKNK